MESVWVGGHAKAVWSCSRSIDLTTIIGFVHRWVESIMISLDIAQSYFKILFTMTER